MNEKIYYNEDFPEGVEPLYNGNIADDYYSAHDSAHFRLSYDGLNRLTASQQYTRDGVKTAAAEAFTYDKMGNITSIVRSTEKPIPNYINRVQLFYDGNRIIRGEGSPYSGGYNDMVYPNLVGKDVEYEYDPNGNLIKNEDNRISLTTYNLLNLPQTIAFSDKSLSVFYYMADGRKIRNATGAYSISTAVPIDSVVKNTDPYISYMSEWNDVYWYQRTQQKYINTPEGNIEVSTGRKMSFSYCYTSKDHLGSIWLYWSSLSNKYSNIYYPSGIMREKRRSPYNYGLTGKEIVYDNGLDEYFFGARTLFAPINRFNQPDPLCEEYYHISPYAYCANNFINVLDPDGKKIIFINGYLGFGSPQGGKAYWSNSFISGAQNFFKDNSKPFFTNVKHGILSSAISRHKNGYNYAKENFSSLTDGMNKDETFKIISHSMGGAFSTGMKEYLEEQGWNIESSIFINTYQSGSIKTKKNDPTFIIDYQNTNDPVLFWLDLNIGKGEIKNSDIKIRLKSDYDTKYIHKGPISSGEKFWDNLKKIIHKDSN